MKVHLPIFLCLLSLTFSTEVLDYDGIQKHIEDHNLKFGMNHRVDADAVLEWKPLRIEFDYYDQSQSKPIIDQVLKIAQTFFATHFLVQREASKLSFADTGQTYCFQQTINANQKAKQYDADIVFFLTFSQESYLASAGPCAFNKFTLRPIFGQIGFGSAFPYNSAVSNIQFEKNVETTIHEMIHGLGFIDSMFAWFYNSAEGKDYKQSSYIKDNKLFLMTPRILAYTRYYFNCPTAKGLPMEDDGGPGTRNAHFERRLLYNEVMTGSDMSGEFIFSIFTFKLLEDSGWYRLQQIDPDVMHFGYRRGCNFLDSGCKGGTFPEFCTQGQQSCSADSTGHGSCREDNLANGCSMIRTFSNFDCRDTAITQPLMDFGHSSMCFTGSFSQKGQGRSSVGSCYPVVCSTDNTTMKFQVGTDSFTCSSNNQVITSAKLDGSVTCPTSINEQCLARNECLDQCNQKGYCVHGQCYCGKGFSGISCETACSKFRYQSQCVTQCPQGTFPDNFSQYCGGCPMGCLNCQTEGSCTMCRVGYTLVFGWCERDFSIQLPNEKVVMQEREIVEVSSQKDDSDNALILSISVPILLLVLIK